MAEQIILREGGARGLTLLQKKALLNTPLAILRGQYGKDVSKTMVVVKKIQVGNPVGDPAYIEADAPPWTAFKKGKGNLQAYLNGLPATARWAARHKLGLSNAIATIRNASKEYSKGKGLTVVGGLVYTRWQAFLQSGKYQKATG